MTTIIKRLFYVSTVTCIFLSSLAAEAASHPLRIAGAETTNVGIYIEDLRTGEVLASVNADKPMVPASVTKSLTTATAYATFSPTGRFTTPVYTAGKIKNGVLEGDVVIATIGDPTIESVHFPSNRGFADSIVSALQRLGIKEITGTVVIDESNFTDQSTPRNWLKADLVRTYGATSYATNYRDNRLAITFPAGSTNPPTPGVTINNASGRGPLRISRNHDSTEFNVSGSASRSYTAAVANPNPSSSMKEAVMRKIKENEIAIGDEPVHKGKKNLNVIYTHKSPQVADILRSLMFRSDNMMAEGMLRSLAPGESRDEAIKRERKFWKDRGVNFNNVVIEDGSGLSRQDRITPEAMGQIYRWMYNSDMAKGYASLFPKAGREGTMRNFMRNSVLDGKLATKTGSMRGVQGFGGYVIDENGVPTHSVVVFVNNFSANRAALKSEIGRYLINTIFKSDAPNATVTDTGADEEGED